MSSVSLYHTLDVTSDYISYSIFSLPLLCVSLCHRLVLLVAKTCRPDGVDDMNHLNVFHCSVLLTGFFIV